MKKRRLTSNCLLIFLLAAPFLALGCVGLSQGQPINTSTVISSNTNWTPANSPYNIAGNVLVNNGVTLTLETGTTVNLNGYIAVTGSLIIQQGVTINIQSASGYIQVDGVLSAVGTSADPIRINGTEESVQYDGVSYTTGISSVTFDENNAGATQTSAESTVENVVFALTTITVAGSAQFSGDSFGEALTITGGAPTVASSVIEDGLSVWGGSPTISGNSISGGIVFENQDGGHSNQAAYVTDNKIVGGTSGGTGGVTFLGTQFYDTVVLEKNLISTGGTNDGIDIGYANNVQSAVIIENNTITDNSVGIDLQWGLPQTITGNNIQDNALNLKIGGPTSFNCSNNWWGTSDQQAIGQTIYDFKDDFSLGTVSFVPYLTAPNPQAAPNTNTTVTTTLPTTTPPTTATPSATEQTSNSSSINQLRQPTTSPGAINANQSQKGQVTVSETTFAETTAGLLAVIAVLVVAMFGLLMKNRKTKPRVNPP